MGDLDQTLPIILAGGLGTRLGSLAQGMPKPMVEVGGRPFLEHLLNQLVGQGFHRVLLLVGHQAEHIMEYFGDGRGRGIQILYSREASPLGTGGALKQAEAFVSGKFLLLYGDLYRSFDYSGFCTGTENRLAVYPYVSGLTTIACANVSLDPTGTWVTRYLKNAPDAGCTHVDAGFGLFRKEVLAELPEGVSSFEALIYPELAKGGRLLACLVDRNFLDIGNPVDLARARATLLQPE
jgi:D-glycero-D-manno-heptose 1,7-bisphosphate phosphatase